MWVPRIRQVRESKGLKQKYVAQKMNIPAPRLSEWERGRTYPAANKLFDLAKVLDCKVDELYVEVKE